MIFFFLIIAGMKRNSEGETGPAPKRHRPMGDTELRLLVYSKVITRPDLHMIWLHHFFFFFFFF